MIWYSLASLVILALIAWIAGSVLVALSLDSTWYTLHPATPVGAQRHKAGETGGKDCDRRNAE